MGCPILRRHIWGYAVCLCPIKGMPGLNELKTGFLTSRLCCVWMTRLCTHSLFSQGVDGEDELQCKICNQFFISVHNKKEHMFGRQHITAITSRHHKYLSCLVGKPAMRFPSRSDINRLVQTQKRARILKFRI